MRDKPPERNRRSENSLRRFETGVGTSLALAVLSLIAVGGQVRTGFDTAAMAPAPPASGSGISVVFAILGLIALNALILAAETAVEALKPVHVKFSKEKDARRAVRLQTLIDQRTRIVAACTLAAQTVRLAIYAMAFLLAPGVLDLLSDRFAWSHNFANIVVCWVILIIPVGLVHLVVGELLPKSFASVHPMQAALMLYRLLIATSALFSIPAGLVTRLREWFLARFRGKGGEEGGNLAEEEIKSLAENAQESGEIESDEKELLHSVFDFTDTVAREVMTPRVDMDAMPVRSEPTKIAKLIQDTGHSRIPLYEDTDDQIVGIIHAKDLFMAMLNGKAPKLRSLMRPALFVPENKSLHELLAEMRQSRSQMAIVQDEFGGTAGIVTIEDIVEELVGDIVDEYDVEEPEVVETAGGWLVDGRTHLDDANDALGSQFDSEEFDTIGGFVFGLFGKQPKLGEAISGGGHRFTVAESDGRRILRLLVERLPETADVGAKEAAGD